MDHPTNAVCLSPQLAGLSSEIDSGNIQALDAFWAKVEAHGTPLIEPLANTADHYLVTFLWRADEPVENVVLISDLVANTHWSTSFASSAFERLGSTNLYYRTFSLRSDACFTYHLSINQRLPDPSNPASYRASW